MDLDQKLTFSESLAMENELAAKAGVLSFASENIVKPLVNASIVETYNAGASTLGLTELTALATKKPESTASWLCQTASTGIGGILPYAVAIGLTRRGFTHLAGEGESGLAKFLKHETTSAVAGASLFDGLRKPKEGETRLGNALGGASAFLAFERGNHLAKNLQGLQKWSVRAITGATGGAAHTVVSDLVSHHKIDGEKLSNSMLSGAAMNMFLPAILDRLAPRMPEAPLPEPAPSAKLISMPDLPSGARGRLSAKASDSRPFGDGTCFYEEAAEPQARIDMHSATQLTKGTIQEFYRSVATALRDFRRSPEYYSAREASDRLVYDYREHQKLTKELLNGINAGRGLRDQVSAKDLSADRNFLDFLVRDNYSLRSLARDWAESRQDLMSTVRQYVGELRFLKQDLRWSVNNILAEEFNIPRVGLRFGLLPKKTSGFYTSGMETLNSRLLGDKPSEFALVLSHETGHAYQDVLVMRHLADRLGFGREVSGYAVQQLRMNTPEYLGQHRSDSWLGGILAIRDGRRLRPEQAAHAERLSAEWHETGMPSPTEHLLKNVLGKLRNPVARTPVTDLIVELQDPQLRRTLFTGNNGSSALDQAVRRFARRENVDTQSNRTNLARDLREFYGDEKARSYIRYVNAMHERDAFNLEAKVREIVQELLAKRR